MDINNLYSENFLIYHHVFFLFLFLLGGLLGKYSLSSLAIKRKRFIDLIFFFFAIIICSISAISIIMGFEQNTPVNEIKGDAVIEQNGEIKFTAIVDDPLAIAHLNKILSTSLSENLRVNIGTFLSANNIIINDITFNKNKLTHYYQNTTYIFTAHLLLKKSDKLIIHNLRLNYIPSKD